MHILSFKILSDNSASFTSSRMKDLCQKWEGGKTNYSRRLQSVRNGIVECLEIIDVGCNLKQFDGFT